MWLQSVVGVQTLMSHDNGQGLGLIPTLAFTYKRPELTRCATVNDMYS